MHAALPYMYLCPSNYPTLATPLIQWVCSVYNTCIESTSLTWLHKCVHLGVVGNTFAK